VGHRQRSIYHVEKENPDGRRHLVTLHIGRNGADAAWRAGGPPSMQARHRAVLQPGPARRGPDQGLHEGTSPLAFRALQGGALPSLAEAVSVTPKMTGIFTVDYCHPCTRGCEEIRT